MAAETTVRMMEGEVGGQGEEVVIEEVQGVGTEAQKTGEEGEGEEEGD